MILTIKQHLKNKIYDPLLHNIVNDLHTRFDTDALNILKCFTSLLPTNNFENVKWEDGVENVVSLYPEDFPDRDELKNDLNIFLNVVRIRGQYKDLKTLQDVTMKMVELRHNSESGHLQIFKLYCLMLTLPVSTASNERVFSALKILKTRPSP